MKTIEYLRLIKKIGFEQALKIDFKGHENRDEALYIFWYKKCGILLCFNTYADDINGGSFYYNWIPKDDKATYKFTSSGSFRKFKNEIIWIGDHDCRNNIDINIKNLRENGKFVVPWMERPFLWLLHYMDDERHNEEWNNEGWKLVNERRILQLPKDIQIAIKGKDDKKCKKCGVILEEDEPQQNGMCIDCFAADWGELVEISPIVSPQIDILNRKRKKRIKTKGMSITFSFGKNGGFYFYRGWMTRLCLGRFAITIIPEDIDDIFEHLVPHRRKQ